MRNYDLTFFDKKIENQYLEFQQSSRFTTFKVVTLGLLATFLIRVIMCFVDNNFSWFFYKLGMVIYLIIQYFFMLWKPKLIRMALILTNIATMGFFLDEENSIQVSNLRSSNVMAVNLMIILTGEFVDSIFQAGAITILKLYITFNNSQINYPILISAILINFSMLYYTYTYHKGKRSQFLLGLVETGWDKIFFQIIKESSILLSFSYKNLNFNILRFKKFPFQLTDQTLQNESKEKQILNFLFNSTVGSISFQQYLLDCIKTLQNGKENLLFKSNYIKFKRKVFLVKLSIFQTKTPMILLKMKEKNKFSQKQLKNYQRRFILLNNSFLNILCKIENELQNNIQIKQMKRKLMIVKIIEELLHEETTFKFVNISNIISQLKILYLDKQILFENWINLQTINTIPNAFFLLFLVVIENSLIDIVQIRIQKIENEQYYMFEFSGNFNNNQIKKIYQNTRYQTRLITSDTYISKHLVQFILYSDPLCSSTEDLYTYEYQDLLLSNEY